MSAAQAKKSKEPISAVATTSERDTSGAELVPVDPSAHLTVDADDGRFVVQRQVVAKIMGLAIREVPGVHELVAFNTGEKIAHLADRITGSEARDLGVHVEIGTVECAADVRMICDYGVSLPEVARAARENVTRRVKEMTGLIVREFNIHVVDLYFPREDIKPTGRQLR